MEIILQTGLLKLLPTPITYMLLFYFACKFFDFASGILKCLKSEGAGYRSSKMRDGIIKWIGELIAILFVMGLDLIIGLNFILCGATLSLFIFKEGGSILENLAECGVNVPDAVKERLEIFNSNKNSDLPVNKE